MSSEYRSVFSFYEFSKHVHKHRAVLFKYGFTLMLSFYTGKLT